MAYSDHFPGDAHYRIVIQAVFGDNPPTAAIIDTGAPWCILNPAEGASLATGERIDDTLLHLRMNRYRGGLYRIPVSLEAERGSGITIQATVFIADIDQDEVWRHPNFLGLSGFLERLRFAIDPEHNLFYFGTNP
jgi:hypothetical protein